MPYFPKTKGIFLLRHFAAASRCSLRKSPIIYHREQLYLSMLCNTSIRPARPFWELLRNHLSGRLPVIFLVYMCLSVGRTWGQRGKEPAPCVCSPPAPHNLLHCAPLPQHRLGPSFRNLHPLFCLGRVNISKVMFIFFCSNSSTFLLCSRQRIPGSPYSISKTQLWSCL